MAASFCFIFQQNGGPATGMQYVNGEIVSSAANGHAYVNTNGHDMNSPPVGMNTHSALCHISTCDVTTIYLLLWNFTDPKLLQDWLSVCSYADMFTMLFSHFFIYQGLCYP